MTENKAMNRIELRNRTEFHVKEYYQRVQDAEIRRMIPLKAQSLEEALNDYYCSISPNSSSYGCTIYVDDIYVVYNAIAEAIKDYDYFNYMMEMANTLAVATNKFTEISESVLTNAGPNCAISHTSLYLSKVQKDGIHIFAIFIR